MIDRDDLPETPDWTCEPRGWCESACTGICESPQQHIYLIGENIELGAE